MTFETEMDNFFMRNCYFGKDREKVEASQAYQLAVQMKDVTQAKETATRILEAKPLDS